jgi:hypothetical protein
MPSDSESRIPGPPARDLWKLPKVVKLAIERVRYSKPRRHVVAGRVVEFPEGVEILIRTSAEIPVRALSPALFIGSIEVAENEQVAQTEYRFFVLNPERLVDGAAIGFGWAGSAGRRSRTGYRYRKPGRSKTR